MTEQPRPPEQLRNSTDDADYIQALEEVEEITVEAMAEAKERFDAEMAKLKADATRKIEMLTRQLGIDKPVFKERLADRAEDRKHFARKQKRAAKIPADKLEYWMDISGQTSFLPPGEPAPDDVVETLAERANRERNDAVQKASDEWAEEGEAVLDELTSLQVH